MFLCAGTIAATDYNVLQQGAVGDGKTLNTKSLQSAIDALHAKGGGQLYFPAGRYLTGSLQLKSNVTLYLEKEAVLLGSTSPYDYPGFSTEKELKVNNDHFDQALIYAEGAENIGITGEGCIDASGRTHDPSCFLCVIAGRWSFGRLISGVGQHGDFLFLCVLT